MASESSPLAYDQLLARLVAWGEADPDVRAIAVVGARAREDHPADAWSDLDVLLVVTDPARFLADAAWLAAIGEVWLSFIERSPGGESTERRALFAGGLDVDITPLAAGTVQHMVRTGLSPLAAALLARGTRFVLDKDGVAKHLAQAPAKVATPVSPGQADYLQLVHDFLYHVVWTAKKLRRGEVWTAATCLNGYQAFRLLQMIEWHAHAVRGVRDTWHNGRFLEEWADPRAVADLRGAFALYDADDVARALWAALALFHWLAVATGFRLGFEYPDEAEKRVADITRALLGERGT